jgi:hypothetical protein
MGFISLVGRGRRWENGLRGLDGRVDEVVICVEDRGLFGAGGWFGVVSYSLPSQNRSCQYRVTVF